MSQYVNHNRQIVEEFQSAKGFVKPVREGYPPTALPNPGLCPERIQNVKNHSCKWYPSVGQMIAVSEWERSKRTTNSL